jgi:hypothetical protein
MKLQNIALLFLSVFFLDGCASGYQVVNPPAIHYLSTSNDKSVTLEYKYNLLNKKYTKKEINNNIRVIAVKIVNNSPRDLVFGNDIKLTYGNGNEVSLVENDKVFKSLKQQTGFYLFYLLLTPATFSTTSNGVQSSSVPIGYGVRPGFNGNKYDRWRNSKLAV